MMHSQPVTEKTVNWARSELSKHSPEEGLTFLELLAHNLTTAVRIVANDRTPHGELPEEDAYNAMYWINEAIHDVVQRTRELRIQQRLWDAEDITEWVVLWLSYKHAAGYVKTAVERSFWEMTHPCNQRPSA